MSKLNKIIIGEMAKEANGMDTGLLIGSGSKAVKNIGVPLVLLSLGASAVNSVIRPLLDSIRSKSDHVKVLNRIKENYEPELHPMLDEVYSSVIHTAPHLGRNYLLAKTVVDDQMAMIEASQGSSPRGHKINMPVVDIATSIESRTPGAPGRPRGTFSDVGGAVIGNISREVLREKEEKPGYLQELAKKIYNTGAKHASEDLEGAEKQAENSEYVQFLRSLLNKDESK